MDPIQIHDAAGRVVTFDRLAAAGEITLTATSGRVIARLYLNADNLRAFSLVTEYLADQLDGKTARELERLREDCQATGAPD